ncbi:MAG: carboxymuconolactone decarboxylase family protein [Peptococcaceae bacterium]|nr:carboxymuconolactone decarboxylase family protein [Peptococcaceae bacterium]
MLEAWNAFGMYILNGSSLPARDREILILRTGWLTKSEYEFGQHTLVGKKVGLTSEEINRITKGPDEPGWDSFDAALLRAADELHEEYVITDATWKVLSKRYNEKQLIDVVMTVGHYTMVSMFLNTNRVPLDEGVPGFPKN